MSEEMTAAKTRVGPSPVRTRPPESEELCLAPGTVLFQQWRLVRELGRGAFGVVFEARELNLDEIQAVKVLYPSMVTREESLERFRREVRTMRSLSHARIGRVYDYREDLERHLALISMELVPGGTVRHLLEFARHRGQHVPLVLAQAIFEQVLAALAEAHRQKVIHRDVAPGNVLLSGGSPEDLFAASAPDPGVKLVDFGIAGLLEASRTLPDRGLGTVAYMAPEILSSQEVTPAADVYGVGAVVYELLTGEPPLGRFDVPTRLRPSLARAFEALLLVCLERRPEDRPSAAEALERCRELARSGAVARNGVDTDASTGSIPLVGNGVEPVDEADEISDIVLTTTSGELGAPRPAPEGGAPAAGPSPGRPAVLMAAAIGLFLLALGLGALLRDLWLGGPAPIVVASKDDVVGTPSPAAPLHPEKVASDGDGSEGLHGSDARAAGTDGEGVEPPEDLADRAAGTNGHGVERPARRERPAGRETPGVPMAVVEFRSVPERAFVYPKGSRKALGCTPFRAEVPFGRYEFEAQRAGCTRSRETLTVSAAGPHPVDFSLECPDDHVVDVRPAASGSAGVSPASWAGGGAVTDWPATSGSDWPPYIPRREPVLGIVFVYLPADDLRPFWMSETDVTQGQWKELMGGYPPRSQRCDDCPVVSFGWDEARRFCNRLSRSSGYGECYRWPECEEGEGSACGEAEPVAGCDGYRLPDEVEWGYAERHPDWRRPDGYGLRLVRLAD